MSKKLKSERDTKFGQALRTALSTRSMMQSDLAEKLDVSSAYVSSISTGAKRVSANRVDAIASVLDLSQKEKTGLHRAAAQDLGFSLDLPDDF